MPSLKRITLDYSNPYSAPPPPPPPPQPCKCNLFTPPPQTPPPVSPFQAPSNPNSVPFHTPSAPPPYFLPTAPASNLAPSPLPSPQTSHVAGNGAVIGVSVSLGSIFLAILSYGLFVLAKKPLTQFRIGGGKDGGAPGTGVSQHDGEAGGGGIRGESAAEVSSKVQPVFVSDAIGSDMGTSSIPDPTREDPDSEHLCSQFASFLSKANILADNLLSQCQTSDPSKVIHHNKLREEQSSLSSRRDKLNQRFSQADQKTPPDKKLTTSLEPPSEDARAVQAEKADEGVQGQDIKPPSGDARAKIADGGLQGQDIQSPSEDDRAEKPNGRVQGQDIQPPLENAGAEKADERVQGQDVQPPTENAGAEKADERVQGQDIQPPLENAEVENADERVQGQDIQPPTENAGAEKADEGVQGQDIQPPLENAEVENADERVQGQDIQPPPEDAGAENADERVQGQDVQPPSENAGAENADERVQGQDTQPPSENAGAEKADERVQGQDIQPPPEDAGAEEADESQEGQDIQPPSEDTEAEKADEKEQGQEIEPEEDEEETVKKLLKSKIMRKILARKAPMLYRKGFMACKKQLQSRGLLHHSAVDELLDEDFGLHDVISQWFGENEEDEEEAEEKEEETLTSSSKQQMLSNKQLRSPARMGMKIPSPSARKNVNPLNKVKNSIDTQDLISLHRQDDADDDLPIEAPAEEAKIGAAEEAEQEEDLVKTAAAEDEEDREYGEDTEKILSAVETSSTTQQTANKTSRKTQSPVKKINPLNKVKNTFDTQDLINVTASSSIQRTGNKTNIKQQFRPPASVGRPVSVGKKHFSLAIENKAKNIIGTQDPINVNRTSSDDAQAARESQEGIELIAEEATTEEAAGEYREGIEEVSEEVKADEAAGESEEGIEMVGEEAKAEEVDRKSQEGIELVTKEAKFDEANGESEQGNEVVAEEAEAEEAKSQEGIEILADEAKVEEADGESHEGIEVVAEEAKAEEAARESQEGIEVDTHNLINYNQTSVDHTGDEAVSSKDSIIGLQIEATGEEATIEAEAVGLEEEDLMMAEQVDAGEQGKDFENSLSHVKTLSSSRSTQQTRNQTGERIKQFRSPESTEMKRPPRPGNKKVSPLNKVNVIDSQALINLNQISRDDAGDEAEVGDRDEDLEKMLGKVKASSSIQLTGNKANSKQQLRSPESMGKKTSTIVIINKAKIIIGNRDPKNVTHTSSDEDHGGAGQSEEGIEVVAEEAKADEAAGESEEGIEMVGEEAKAEEVDRKSQEGIELVTKEAKFDEANRESEQGNEVVAEEAKEEEATEESQEGIEILAEEAKVEEADGESQERIEVVAEEVKAEEAARESQEAKAEEATDEYQEGIEVDTHNLINHNQTRVDGTGDEAVSSQDSTNGLPTGEEVKIEAEEAVVLAEEDLMMAEHEDAGEQGKDFKNSLSHMITLSSSRSRSRSRSRSSSTQQTRNQTGVRIKQFRSPESMEMKRPPRPGKKNVSPLNKVNVIDSQALINLNKISRDDADGNEAEVGDRDEDLEKMLGKVKASSSIQQTGNKANSKQQLQSPESMGKKTSTVVIMNKAKNIIGTRDPKNVTQTSSDEAHGRAGQSEEGIEVVEEETKAEEAAGESQVVEEIEVVEAARESQIAQEAKVEEAVEEAKVAEEVTVEEVGESQVVEAKAEEAAGESQVTEEAKAEEAVGKSQVAEEAKAEKADA